MFIAAETSLARAQVGQGVSMGEGLGKRNMNAGDAQLVEPAGYLESAYGCISYEQK